MTRYTRRRFLKGSAASFAGATGLLAALGNRRAHAADTSGYRALVCVFLFGGLDHADTVFPFEQAEFEQLAAIRSGLFSAYSSNAGIARTRDNLLELDVQNAGRFGRRRFALAPGMNELQTLFNAGEAAIVGNVGPLIEPTDQESFQFESVALPPRLFSHNDQQSTWMALGVEGTQLGWGGRFADAALTSDPTSNPLFTAVSASGNQIFLAGEVARQFSAAGNSGAQNLNITDRRFILGPGQRGVDQRAAIEAFYEQDNFENPDIMARDYARISSIGINNVRGFNNATSDTIPFATEFPSNSLGRQMRVVAETIEARDVLGVSRQVFFVGIGGFDTHSDQPSQLPQRQAQISGAINAFRNAMIERNLWENVTVFTASDFGRTLIDNGDGTDHGWGGHHFVVGGDVNGGQIFGDILRPDPTLSQYTPNGRPIPSTSVEQYAATLGSWFGLNQGELQAALPNLVNFDTSDLGFL